MERRLVEGYGGDKRGVGLVIELAQVRAVPIVCRYTVLWVGCVDKVTRHGGDSDVDKGI